MQSLRSGVRSRGKHMRRVCSEERLRAYLLPELRAGGSKGIPARFLDQGTGRETEGYEKWHVIEDDGDFVDEGRKKLLIRA